MLKKNLVTVGIVASVIMMVVVVNKFQPSRIGQQQIVDQDEVKKLLRKAEEIEAEKSAQEVILETKSTFTVEFECSNGTFVVVCYSDWSPVGVAHFKEAIEAGVYDQSRFFRVVPNFVVQFGIAGDPELSAVWREKNIVDEPAKQSNTKGMVTFAKSGAPNSRTTQIFINLGDNARLDGMGFAPIGQVISGMEVVEAINSEHGDRPTQAQAQIQSLGNKFLDENFPNLDFIIKATIVSSEETEES
ncbi:MAG: peptidylprolyl isomerase [Candidatus Hydrogenedentes bacterium]|nr:peptidylprolyl isomerase [Candidatus Hydrogenedentota bacterium]